MCLIAFAIHADPACPLLIAGNRDEFMDRPTAGLHRWSLPGGGEVVAGRDLRDGGTWLGVSPGGRVAMLTNVRDAHPGPGQRSRGELATRWLQGELDWHGLQTGIDPGAYGGFNLVIGDFHQRFWAWLGNRHPDRPHEEHAPALHTQTLGAGIYGLSNATLDTPWPKTQRLKQAVGESLTHVARPGDAQRCLSSLALALADDRMAADLELPRTGVPHDLERALSSPFVRMPERAYGTRSSLVLRVMPQTVQAPAASMDASGGTGWQVQLDEWTHAPPPVSTGQHSAGGWPGTTHRRETLIW